MLATAQLNRSHDFWLIAGEPVVADMNGHNSCHVQVVLAYALQQAFHAVSELTRKESRWLGCTLILEHWLERVDDEIDITELREQVLNWSDSAHRRGVFSDAEVEDIVETLARCSGLDEGLARMALGSYGDAEEVRSFGRVELGWIRVTYDQVECSQLTRKVMREMADGLEQIHGGSVLKQTFCVEERQAHRYFRNVPWTILAAADPSELRPYQTLT